MPNPRAPRTARPTAAPDGAPAPEAPSDGDAPPRIGTNRPASERLLALPDGYAELLDSLKSDIRTAQVRAALAANRELIALYWRVGRAIVERQAGQTWGTAVLERLSADVRRAVPGVAGFSRTNLFRMRAFFLVWSRASPMVPQPVGQLTESRQHRDIEAPDITLRLPWGHNVVLIESVRDAAARAWYAHAAVQHGWSRNVLEIQIASDLWHRQGGATTNFSRTLPAPESDLAQQTLKDSYVFDCLTLAPKAREQDVERGLMAQVERFLLELGAGFAFVGRQVRLDVGGEEFRMDLLFYHLRLRCYVVVDLKSGKFRPEYTGKLNVYLSAVDDLMRHPDDRPTIGLLLCRSRERTVVEYALRGLASPIGVADWQQQVTAALPGALGGSLPTVEELEREFGGGDDG